jgi:hypothetical protein
MEVGFSTKANRFPSNEWVTRTTVIGAVTTAPTKGTISRDTLRWKREGDSMRIRIEYYQTAGGSVGSGIYLFAIPDGFTIDQNKQSFNTSTGSPLSQVGAGVSTDLSTYTRNLQIQAYDTKNIAALAVNVGAVGSSSSGMSGVVAYTLEALVPILQWA